MSDVTPTIFRDAVFAAFDTFWADRTPVAYPNLEFDPDSAFPTPGADDAWARLFLLGSADGMERYSSSVLSNHWSRSGVLTLEAYGRQGGSTDRVYELADAFMQWLENPGVANTVFSEITQPQEVGPDGTWFQVVVTANWLYFTDRAA